MDEELKRRFAPKRLGKHIPGQRLLPTSDFKFFRYGNLEQVYPMKFEFVYYFGGFSDRQFRGPLRDSLGLCEFRKFWRPSFRKFWRASTTR